ncbi:MAG: type II toxin-antitoxin system HicB family antitoxin [Patescibacteria group bacterium]
MVKQTKVATKSGFNALVWQEGNIFVAKTLEIELASQGKTIKESLNNLEEAIELYFENEKINTTKIPLLLNPEIHQIFPRIINA